MCNEITGKVKNTQNYHFKDNPKVVSNNFNIYFNPIVTKLQKDILNIPPNFNYITSLNQSIPLILTMDLKNPARSIKNKFSSGDNEIPISIVNLSINFKIPYYLHYTQFVEIPLQKQKLQLLNDFSKTVKRKMLRARKIYGNIWDKGK